MHDEIYDVAQCEISVLRATIAAHRAALRVLRKRLGWELLGYRVKFRGQYLKIVNDLGHWKEVEQSRGDVWSSRHLATLAIEDLGISDKVLHEFRLVSVYRRKKVAKP